MIQMAIVCGLVRSLRQVDDLSSIVHCDECPLIWVNAQSADCALLR